MVPLITMLVTTPIYATSPRSWFDTGHRLLTFILNGWIKSVASLHVLYTTSTWVGLAMIIVVWMWGVRRVRQFYYFLLTTRLGYSYGDSVLHLGALLSLGGSSILYAATATLISLHRTIVSMNSKISWVHKLVVFSMLLHIFLVKKGDAVNCVAGHLPILFSILFTEYYISLKRLHAPTLASHSCILG